MMGGATPSERERRSGKQGITMDLIERIFGIAPDGRDGTTGATASDQLRLTEAQAMLYGQGTIPDIMRNCAGLSFAWIALKRLSCSAQSCRRLSARIRSSSRA